MTQDRFDLEADEILRQIDSNSFSNFGAAVAGAEACLRWYGAVKSQRTTSAETHQKAERLTVWLTSLEADN